MNPKKLLIAAGLVLLGGALALVGARVLQAPGQPLGSAPRDDARLRELYQQQLDLAEERCRKEAEFTLLQALRLVEFRRFAERGQDVSLVVVASEGATAGSGTRLPRVVIEPAARQEWTELGRQLSGLEGGVDPRVFETFREVREFAAGHPWPAGTDLGSVRRSGWGRSDVVDRWLVLNRNLSSRVTAALGRFYAG